MRYLSVCSGIEAATVAWHHLGWEPAGFSEIEKFPSQVLGHHYPNVPKLGDMTKYKEWNIGAIDLLVGGTPCQSFSVAGLRKGLEDPRGNLALVYCGILDHFRPKWFVWENVPGVLSSAGGRDFGSFLGALAQLGYGFAYRVLDAQYFGVAQRRRRVFVVGYLGDWRPAAAVLFERESLRRDSAPSRKKREDPSVFTPSSIGGYRQGFGTLRANGGDIGGGSENIVAKCLTRGVSQRLDAESKTMIPVGVPDVMATLLSSTAGISRPGNAVTEHETYSQIVGALAAQPGMKQTTYLAQPVSIQGNLIGREAGGPQGVGASDEGVMYTLTKADVHGVSYGIRTANTSSNGWGIQQEITHTLDTAQGVAVAQPVAFQSVDHGADATCDLSPTLRRHDPMAVMQSMAVRRLTPVECERLQGFPDGYTDIKPKGKDTPDGPRYKALGNSMAVPVMRWIAERIANVEGS